MDDLLRMTPFPCAAATAATAEKATSFAESRI
jgi:hypothetical protein